LYKTFSLLFLISIGLRAIDVVKNLYIASKLGVTYQADVFLSLASLPDSLLVLFGLDSLKGIINSEYSSEINKSQYNISESFNNLFRLLLVIGAIITVLILVFRVELIKLLLPGFADERLTLAVYLSVFILPVFFIKPVSALLSAYYNSVKQYYIPVVPQVLVSLSILFFVYFPILGTDVIVNIAYGFLIGSYLYFIVLILPQIFNKKIHFFKLLELDKLSRKIIKTCFMMFVVVMTNQIYLFTKNFFVSYFDDGSLAAINYGTSLPTFISSLTFTVVFGIILNNLSKLHSLNLVEDANKLLSNTINSIIYIYIPIVVIMFLFNINILNILYLRGNFDSHGIELTSNPFIWESLSLIPFVLFIMPVAMYLAYKDYKKYSKIGIIVYVAGILFNFILTKIFGYYGISIGTFINYSFMAFMLIYFSKTLSLKLKFDISDSFKLIFLGTVLTAVTYFFKIYVLDIYLIGTGISALLIGSIFVFLLYYITTVILKINYLNKIKLIF